MYQILIFGIGNRYNQISHYIDDRRIKVIGAIDNNPCLTGKKIKGLKVYPVDAIKDIDFDAVVIAHKRYIEMTEQLLEIGIPQEKIIQEMNYIPAFPDAFWFGDELIDTPITQCLFVNNFMVRGRNMH